MKRVLVTGASGFIGRACVAALRTRGWDIVGLCRTPPASPPHDIDWRSVDLLDTASVRRVVSDADCSHLLHLAWDVRDGYWTSGANLDWTAATLTLVNAFAQAGGRRFVGAGTCAEYDWAALGEALIAEDAPRRPHTLYGAAKSASWDVLNAFGESAGLSVAWGVVFHIIGADDRASKLIPSIVDRIRAREPALCSPGKQKLDVIDVRDLGAAFAALIDSPIDGRVNLGSGEVWRVADLARFVAELGGRPDLLRLGALPAREGEPPVLAPDLKKLSEKIGFKSQFSVHIALKDVVSRRAGAAP